MPRTRSPEETYYAEQNAVGKLWARLDNTIDPVSRAGLLLDAADRLAVMAAAIAQFDTTIDADDGYTPAEWAMWESRLARLVANTESALVGLPTSPNADAVLESIPGVQAVLARLTTLTTRRSVLIDELYEAVVDTVGVQAVEVLARIARAYRTQEDKLVGQSRWTRWLKRAQSKRAHSGVS